MGGDLLGYVIGGLFVLFAAPVAILTFRGTQSRRDTRRRKMWAAGMAGDVGFSGANGGDWGGGSSCSGGSSSCGGGGCGGGCGGS